MALLPLLARTRTRILFDHCGRPDVSAGLRQPAFRALLSLAGGERCSVKLSGLAKFSRQPYPFSDGHPYLLALLDAFGAENCMWVLTGHSCAPASGWIWAPNCCWLIS